MPPQQLQIIITAVNQAQATLTQMQGSLQQLLAVQQQLTQSNLGMGQSARSAAGGVDMLGLGMTSLAQRIERALVFFLAFRAFWSAFNFITERVRDLFELEQQLKRVQSATIFEPGGIISYNQTLKLLTDNMVKFGLTAKEVGNAIFELISAGLTSADALKLIPTVLGLVKAGVSDIGTASRAAAAIFKTWGVDAQRLGDTLAFILNQSQVEINGLITGLQRAAGTSRVAGLSFDQTAVALAVLNDGMIFGGNAGRAFRRGLEQIATETSFLEERFGIVVDRTRDMGSQLDSIIAQLGKRFKEIGGKEALGALAEQFSKFGILGVQAISVLTAFADRYGELLTTVKSGDIAGGLEKIVAIRMDTAIEQFERLKATMTSLLPVGLLNSIKGFSRDLSDMSQFGLQVGTAFSEMTKHALSFVGLQGSIKEITETLKTTSDPAKVKLLQERLAELNRQLGIDKERVMEIFQAISKLAPEIEGPIKTFLQSLGLIAREIQAATKETEQFAKVWRVLSQKSFDFAASLKDLSIDERRLVLTNELNHTYETLSKFVKEILDAQKGTANLSNLRTLDLTKEADLQAFLKALQEGRLATEEGMVQTIEKVIGKLVKLRNEQAGLNKIVADADERHQQFEEGLLAAQEGQIDKQHKLVALREQEVRLAQQLMKLNNEGIKGKDRTGLADFEIEMMGSAGRGRFSESQLKTLAELEGKLLQLRREILSITQQISREDTAAREKQIRDIERQLALELKQIDIRERLARASDVFTAAQERAFNKERLDSITQSIDKMESLVDSLKAAPTLGLDAEQLQAVAERLTRIADTIGLLKERMAELQLTQLGFIDSFLVGVRSGLSELSFGFKEAVKLGKDLIRDLQRALSEGLFDVITKGFSGVGDFFKRLRDTALRFLTDIAANQILGFFGNFLPKAGQVEIGKLKTLEIEAARLNITGAIVGSTLPPGSFMIASSGERIEFPADFSQTAQAATDGLQSVATVAQAAGADLGVFGQMLTFLSQGIGGIIRFLGSLGGGGAGGTSQFLSGLGGFGSVLGGLGKIGASAGIGFGLGSLIFGSGPAGIGGSIGSTIGTIAGMIFPQLAVAIGGMVTGLLPSLVTAVTALGITGPLAFIGNLILPGIGLIIGALVGFLVDLFTGPPTARLYVQFQSTFLGRQKEFLDKVVGSFGAWVSADMPLAEAIKLSNQVAEALSGFLRQLLSATLKAQEVLPSAITAAMNARLAALAASSPFLAQGEREFNMEKPEELKAAIEALPNQMLKLFSEAIFGGIDLTTLQRPGEALGDTFVRVLNSMVGLTQVLEVLGVDMDALVQSMGTGDEALAAFVQRSLAFFQQFAKEGEKFEETLKRVMTAFAGIQAFMQTTQARIAELSGDTGQAFAILVENLGRSEEQLQRMADQLTIAVESGAQPDEILALANALSQAVDQNLQAVSALIQGLNQIRAAILSTANLLAEITIEINRLGGETADVFTEALAVANTLWAQFSNDVMARIAIFNSGLKLAASDVDLLAQSLPILADAFEQLIVQIRQMASAAGAIAALQALAQGITQGLAAAIASTQASFAAQREAIQESGKARLDALNEEKSRIQEVFNARRETLNKELELANQWASVLKSVEAQLKDLFNLMAPTQPLTSLQQVQEQFRAAFAAFQATPTPELAQQVQALGQQVIQLAQGVPGFDLPSLAFQAVVDEVTNALNVIAGMAETGRTTEQIQNDIRILNEQQARALESIDARIQATTEATQAHLAALSAQEQAAIRSLEESAAAALRDIRAELVVRMEALRLEELAASEALRVILGDKTFEQFISEKQAQAVDWLTRINATLEFYLGAIARQVAPAQLPAAQHGMEYVPRTMPILVHQGEMILPSAVADWVRSGTDSSGVVVNLGGITIHVADGSGVNARRLAEEVEEAVLNKLKVGRIREAVKEIARRV